MSLDSATGVIGGTAYLPGSFTFTVKVWDKQIPNAYDTKQLSIDVAAVDSDGDGLGDGWEMEYFGDLGQGAAGDSDSDGFLNITEYRNGSDPTATEAHACISRQRNVDVGGPGRRRRTV